MPRAYHRVRVSLAHAASIALLVSACTAPDGKRDRTGTPGPAGAGSTSSAQSTPQTSADPVAALRRPWARPPLAAGQKCPVTTEVSRPDPAIGSLWGTGPARPAGFTEGAVLDYMPPGRRADWQDKTWGGQKVLWAIDPAQRGPVLVRGRQLDGAGELAFEDPPIRELVLTDSRQGGLGGGWLDYPSHTRLRAPGCYAYQIDTADGSWTVVFIARVSNA